MALGTQGVFWGDARGEALGHPCGGGGLLGPHLSPLFSFPVCIEPRQRWRQRPGSWELTHRSPHAQWAPRQLTRPHQLPGPHLSLSAHCPCLFPGLAFPAPGAG